MGNNLANTTHVNNAGLILAQRRRRWASIKPALFQCVVVAGWLDIDFGSKCTLFHPLELRQRDTTSSRYYF